MVKLVWFLQASIRFVVCLSFGRVAAFMLQLVQSWPARSSVLFKCKR